MTQDQDAAHSTTLLVESMFQTLQRQVERIAGRLDRIAEWQAQADVRFERLGSGQDALNAKVGVQNGGVKEALKLIAEQKERCDAVQLGKDLATARTAGKQDVRDSEKRIIQSVLDNVSHPLVYLFIGIAIGAAGLLAGRIEYLGGLLP